MWQWAVHCYVISTDWIWLISVGTVVSTVCVCASLHRASFVCMGTKRCDTASTHAFHQPLRKYTACHVTRRQHGFVGAQMRLFLLFLLHSADKAEVVEVCNTVEISNCLRTQMQTDNKITRLCVCETADVNCFWMCLTREGEQMYKKKDVQNVSDIYACDDAVLAFFALVFFFFRPPPLESTSWCSEEAS